MNMTSSGRPLLALIAGPTASGKSDLAVALAQVGEFSFILAGLGIALARTALGLDYARLHGLSNVRTWNDTINQPILALNQVDLLRDVFVWAYERSCTRYSAVVESMGKPEPIRLAYREELRALVHDMVVAGVFPDPEKLRRWANENGAA